MNTKIIKFDINKNLYDTLIAKQGDTKSRFLLFNLLDGSIPFSLENRSVRVYAVKPDRTEVFNDLIITDAAKGYCILELTTQMLAVAGTVKLELMVIEDDKKLTSNIFYMDVKKSINSEKAVVSTNEFGALLTALASLNEYDNYKNEIIEARKGEKSLKYIIDKILEELLKKINIGDGISVGQLIGQINENQITDSLKAIIMGNAPISPILKEKSITNRILARNSVGVPEASFLVCGKNLYDKTRRTLNRVMQGSTPSTYNHVESENYDITDYIFVIMGETYSCNVGARNIYLFNTAGECIGVITTSLNTSTAKFTFTAPQTGYIRASLYKTHVDTWQLEEGDAPTRYEDYKQYLAYDVQKNINIEKKQVTDFSVESDDCNFFEVGKNLLNPAKFLNGKLISKNNTVVDNQGYNAYMIELEAGTYTVSSRTRNVFQFDSNLTGTGLINTISNVTANDPIIFTIDKKSWIGINFFADATNMQLEANSELTPYESYGYCMDKLRFTKEQMESIKNEVVISDNNSSLKIAKENNKFIVYSQLNDKETIKYETEIEDVRNKCFNFVNTYLIKDNKETLIHNQGDDITPIRTFYTVGANHGYPCFSIPKNGQTTADIGSVWTDGTTDYVLAKVENNKCIFLYPYTEDEQGIVGYSNVAPVNNLEAKLNVTNINALDITNLTVEQFYPSTNKHTYKVLIDGKELVEGDNLGNEFTVTEKYNILCYKSIQEHLKANVGIELTGDNLNAIDGVVELCINYKFKDKGLVLINHSLKVLKKVTLGNCGFLQSVRLQPNTQHYMPNVKQKGNWNFSQLTNINSYKDNLKFYLSDCINQEYPVNRYVQHRNDTDNNKVGFTAGYLLDIGNGSNEERLKNNILWDFRSTKKTYPVGYSGGTLEAGAYMNFSMYRKYIDTSILEDGETNKTYIEVGDSLYIFIDIHKSTIVDNLEIPSKYIDKKINILEQNEGFELINNTVDVRGVNYTIKNDYGYAVLKIN